MWTCLKYKNTEVFSYRFSPCLYMFLQKHSQKVEKTRKICAIVTCDSLSEYSPRSSFSVSSTFIFLQLEKHKLCNDIFLLKRILEILFLRIRFQSLGTQTNVVMATNYDSFCWKMVLEISKIPLRTENWNEKNETSASKMNHSVISFH